MSSKIYPKVTSINTLKNKNKIEIENNVISCTRISKWPPDGNTL